MSKFAMLDRNGKVRRVSNVKPHATALPVEYPDLSEYDRVVYSIKQKPMKQWDVKQDKVVVTYDIRERRFSTEKGNRLERIRDTRKRIADGGTTFEQEDVKLKTRTDRNTRDDVRDLYEQFKEGVRTEDITWEYEPHQWETLNQEKAKTLWEVIVTHRDEAYKNQKNLEEEVNAIEGEDLHALSDVNINEGWPATLEDSI